MQEDINIEKRNKNEDNTGTETNKKIPDRKRKFPVLKFNIVFKKIFYLWNNNNKVDTKNFMESFLVLSILDMLGLKIFNLRFLQDSNLRPTA